MDKIEYFKNKYGISTGLFLFNVFLVGAIVSMSFVIVIQKSVEAIAETKVVQEKIVSTKMFENLKLVAKAVYVYDVNANKVIYEKNSSSQLPLASLTKLMTAVTAMELLPKDSQITIKKEFLAEEGDTGLLANESWKLKDLLDFSLVSSSNDGARSIASVIGAFDLKTDDYDLGRKDFITKMNQKAEQLGLTQTYFINESGLDVSTSTSGGYGSAQDVGKLLQYILTKKPDILEATKHTNAGIPSDTKVHTAKNTNVEVSNIPGLLASKTGYTDMAGGNLAVAFDPSLGRPIIVVVLGSTIDGRFDDVNTLVKASLEYVHE